MTAIRSMAEVTASVSFGNTASDYGRYRADLPDQAFDRLARLGVGLPDQRLLDVGAGTGALARGFAARGARVTALDPSATLLAEAVRLASASDLVIDTRIARAEATGFDDGSFDAVTAGTCWHWFDRPAAATETARVLRPGGHLAIVHFDWIPRRDSVVALTQALITDWSPEAATFFARSPAGGTGIYWPWTRDVEGAGFGRLETFSFDIDVPYTIEAWRGRVRASAFVGATHDADWVARFDAEHERRLREAFSRNDVFAPHRVWALIARKASS